MSSALPDVAPDQTGSQLRLSTESSNSPREAVACPGDDGSTGVNYSHRSPKGNRHLRR